MAQKATIFKAELQISDMDRNYYHNHTLTVACHPSETEERMMVRVLAFALHSHEALSFADRIGADDEPDLWQKDLTGAIDLWIDIGQPDEKRIRKACGRAKAVFVYTFSGHSADVWWNQVRAGVEGLNNLTITNLPAPAIQSLAALAQRAMQLQCTIQDGQIWISDKAATVPIETKVLKSPGQGR